MPLLASELYAISQGSKCEGNDQCHYCSAPCKKTIAHFEYLPLPGSKRSYVAKRPGNGFMCIGCWHWKKKSITVEWMGANGKMAGFKDRQTPADWSWYITDDKAWAIQLHIPDNPLPTNDGIYQRLLKPTTSKNGLRFALSFVHSHNKNHLQLCVANEIAEIKKDTPMLFTVNGSVNRYTVYELEEALKNRSGEGKEPGVQMLMHLLGPCGLFPPPKKPEEEEKKMGRPPALEDGRVTKKTVAASGQK